MSTVTTRDVYEKINERSRRMSLPSVERVLTAIQETPNKGQAIDAYARSMAVRQTGRETHISGVTAMYKAVIRAIRELRTHPGAVLLPENPDEETT